MKKVRIDCLQYANWSLKVFEQMREGGLDAVHVTIAYHENFRETIQNLEKWNSLFYNYQNLMRTIFYRRDKKTKQQFSLGFKTHHLSKMISG